MIDHGQNVDVLYQLKVLLKNVKLNHQLMDHIAVKDNIEIVDIDILDITAG